MRNQLPRLEIASPCAATWADMAGDDRVRHCAHCDRTVYNVVALTTTEVLTLLQAEGRMPCLRLWQRADGTVLTADCPVGRRRVGSRRQRVAAALILAALSGFLQACTAPPEPPLQGEVVMGKVACPPPPPTRPKPPRRKPLPTLPPVMGAVAVAPPADPTASTPATH